MVSGAGAALALNTSAWAADRPAGRKARLSSPNAEKRGWLICCQLYTFRDRSFYETLERAVEHRRAPG